MIYVANESLPCQSTSVCCRWIRLQYIKDALSGRGISYTACAPFTVVDEALADAVWPLACGGISLSFKLVSTINSVKTNPRFDMLSMSVCVL